MLDTPSNTISDVRVQSFNIAYEYPVVFTRDAFSSGNRSLIDVLTRRESGKLHRCGIFVDEGVLSAIPDLGGEVETYTWDVLPQNLRTGSKTADIAREICFA
jgi:3-dehydroquinate synthase